MTYLHLSIQEVAKLLREGKVTSTELIEECFENIEKNKDINALNSTYKEMAISQAKIVDEKFSKGEDLPLLAGIPVVIKDNINMINTTTTCSSKILSNYTSIYDATVVEKLKQNGAIIIGKANMDEFAMGSSNETSATGIVKNPVDKTRVPGGSSGGSAACVKANECFASLGTDTGGSIRLPASFCGLVGLKPTYSRVSRYGVVAFGSGLDQVGPLARNVKDCAIMLEAISGYDEKENTSSLQSVPNYVNNLAKDIKGLKIGVAKQFFNFEMNEQVKNAVNNAIEFYKNNGAEIVEVDIKNIDLTLAVYYILSSAEASSNLGRFDGIRYGKRSEEYKDLTDLYVKSRTNGFGSEVKRRIMLGNFVLSSGYYDAYYKKAQKVQQMLSNEFDDVFNKVDALISPVCPNVAFKIGEKINNPLEMYLTDIYTVPVNIVGNPAISFPCGKNSEGLPIGLQLIGKKFGEQTILSLANYFEENCKEGA